MADDLRYRAASVFVNGSRLVADAELFNATERTFLSKLGFPLTNFSQRGRLSQFAFATAADRRYFNCDMDAIAIIQQFFPNNFVYFYDLSIGNLGNQKDKVLADTLASQF